MIGYQKDSGVVIDAGFPKIIEPVRQQQHCRHVGVIVIHTHRIIHVQRPAIGDKPIGVSGIVCGIIHNFGRHIFRRLQKRRIVGHIVGQEQERVCIRIGHIGQV